MFSKVVTLCALVAVSSAGLLPEAHYSAVSSQSYVRHDQPKLAVAKLAVAPVYHAAPAPVTYHAAPAPVTYHAAPAPLAYPSAPVSYAAPAAKITYAAAPAVSYAAPAVSYAAPVAKIAYAAPAVSYAAPVAKVAYAHQEEVAYPKYEYTYSVADGHTGDHKSQQESHDGDVVKGSYSFHEADGSVRTVQYTADDHHGFNAVVHNTAPTAAPHVIKAAPVLLKSAPVYYQH